MDDIARLSQQVHLFKNKYTGLAIIWRIISKKWQLWQAKGMYAVTRNQLEATIMNPTVMSMMVKAKQDDFHREAELCKGYPGEREARRGSLSKARLGLFASAALVLLIVLAVVVL